LDQYLQDYIQAAGIIDDVGGYLFRTARRKSGQLTANPLSQQDAHRIRPPGARKRPASRGVSAIIPSARPAL
jgi:hypothetical protein